MDNIIVVNNSILLNSLTKLRDKNLKSSQFRKEVSNIAKILLFEALRNEETEMRRIQTPFVESDFPSLNENEYVLVPILRVGLPMMEGCLEVLEDAKVGFLAIKRDETTLESKVYYERLPHLEEKTVIILDPLFLNENKL
ncbi:MAG: uracil phosphoribosyltransferase [Sulfurihydrogenibium sp.]